MDLEAEIVSIINRQQQYMNTTSWAAAKIIDLVQLEYDEMLGWYPQELAYWKQQCEDLSLELELEQNTMLKFPTPTKMKDHKWRHLK